MTKLPSHPSPAPLPPDGRSRSGDTGEQTAEYGLGTSGEHTMESTAERRSGHERRTRWRPSHGWRSRDVLRAAALVLALYWVAKLFWFANLLILASFLGVLFGLAVTAGVDRLERFRIPRGLGAFLIVFGFLGLLGLFFAWSGPTLAQQSRELRVRLPEALDRIEVWVEQNRDSPIAGFLLGSVEQAATGGDSAAPAATGPTAAGSDTTGAPGVDAGQQLRNRVISQLSGATRYLFPFLSSTLAVLAGVLLVIFLAIYVAVEPKTYHDGLMHLFPHDARPRAGEVLTAVATVLRRWLVTQLIAMLVIGTVTTVVLVILDVPAAFPLGMLAGLLEFIPTIGPILSAVPAIAMGFIDSPEKALWVAIAYWGIQFLENQLLIPILMREGVDIPPAMTILAQAVMALVFGFIGLLVAVPLLAAGMVVVKMLYVEDVVGDDIDVVEVGEDD